MKILVENHFGNHSAGSSAYMPEVKSISRIVVEAETDDGKCKITFESPENSEIIHITETRDEVGRYGLVTSRELMKDYYKIVFGMGVQQ